jgi:hypothetical protein
MKEIAARDGARAFVDELNGDVVVVSPYVLKLIPKGGRCHACGREMQPWSFHEVAPGLVVLDCSFCGAEFAHIELATEVDCAGSREDEQRVAFIHSAPEGVQ